MRHIEHSLLPMQPKSYAERGVDYPDTSWQSKALAASRGTRTGAFLAAALNADRDALPRYKGQYSVTSDGFIMMNFVARDGAEHWGAFVGPHADMVTNITALARHCKLSGKDAAAMAQAVLANCSKDWRI